MGFDFNPTLWFICGLCRRSFASTETLKDHKLACHLGECMGIKCIVFEERILETEWSPEHEFPGNINLTFNAEHESRVSMEECRNKIRIDCGSSRKSRIKNPYISLTKLTEQEINLSLNQNISRYKLPGKNSCGRNRNQQSSPQSKSAKDKKQKFLKQKLRQTDRCDEDNGSKIMQNDIVIVGPQVSSSEEGIYSEEINIRVKQESPSYDETTPVNSVRTENNYPSVQDMGDQEFIVADLDTTTAHSQHKEILSDDEANDYNSNLANMEIKMDTYDSDVSDTSPEAQTQESKYSIQYQNQQSASLLKYQSTTADDEAVFTPFRCEICLAFFRTKFNLNYHMVCHSSIKPFKCSECPSEFKRKSHLVRHQVTHGRETNIKCRFCSKYFRENRSLLDHERSHTGEKPFKCPVLHCGLAVASKGILSSHIRARHSKELGLQQFVCPTCGKSYGIKRSLNVHIRIHHSHSAQ